MKAGVLGVNFGTVHLGVFKGHPLVEEVRFFSRTQARVDEVSAAYGLAGTTDLDDILGDPAVDVVSVALPHALHADVAVRALEQGKHVICEVPACLSLAEAERMADASERTGRRVFVNLFGRFDPMHRYLQELVVSGEFGRLLSLQSVSRCAPVWGPVPLGLDVLPLESCSCDFDWIGWCAGELTLVEVAAVERDRDAACIDVLLAAPGGAIVQSTTSSLMPLPYGTRGRIEASFERAAVTYRSSGWNADGERSELTVCDAEGERTMELPHVDCYHASLTYSLERIVDGKPGITDLAEALPSLRLALELDRRVHGMR